MFLGSEFIISSLLYLKNDSSKIFDNIVELLISIEQNHDNSNNYTNKIQELKEMINDFSIKNEDMKSKILLNDIKIDTFFQKKIVKKYLSSFNTEIYLPEKNNISPVNIDDWSSNKKIINSTGEEIILVNHTLLVSEKLKKVFLPYTKHEVSLYLEQYPDSYSSFQDVIEKEFILPLDYYMKHPVIARFRETYSLIRDRESKSIIDALKFALDNMFHYELNPVIIATCKTQEQLEHYLHCLEKNKLEDFTDFEIKFEVAPLGI